MSKWISIHKKAPKADVCIDLWFSYGDFEARITDCFFDDNLGIFWKWDADCKIKLSVGCVEISHWMPLPSHPAFTKDITQ